MQRLLSLIFKYRVFLVFVILQVVCGWLIIKNNSYQGAAFFNSSNAVAASMLETKRGVTDYFELKQINQNLASENVVLREMIAQKNQQYNYLLLQKNPGEKILDTAYTFELAKVINNSFRGFKNHLTINKGARHGIEPGMGVISGNGIVGRVKTVTKNYATVISLLHSEVIVSSILSASGTFCSTQWDGKDARFANLNYVPRHINVKKGEKVVTSGYNAIYPADILVGTVAEVNLQDNATFYDIKIELSTDFARLDFVYVVKNYNQPELIALDSLSRDNY